MSSGPLSGIRVLEFTVILSGPYGGCQLSDLGAEVVKVEAPPTGDGYRGYPGPIPGYSKMFQVVNRGKRSIVVNLQQPEGRETIYRMIPHFDMVLINYRSGVPKRLGIDYQTLSALHPRLIYIDLTGFGTSGPIAHRAASDMVSQAYGGSTAHDGRLDPDGAPVWMSIPIGDIPTGMAAAMGGVAALYHRERTGEGQLVSISLLRTVMSQLGYQLMREPVSDATGRELLKGELARVRAQGGSYDDLVRARLRLTTPPARLYEGGYHARDGGIVLGAVTREHRDAIRGVLGIAEDLSERPFDPASEAQQQALAELKQRIRQRLSERTVAEWVLLFIAAGAPASEVNFAEEISDDRQGALAMVEVPTALTGTTRHAAPVLALRHAPTAIQGAPPPLGGDTDDVLTRLGGYSEAEIAALRASGAVA